MQVGRKIFSGPWDLQQDGATGMMTNKKVRENNCTLLIFKETAVARRLYLRFLFEMLSAIQCLVHRSISSVCFKEG